MDLPVLSLPRTVLFVTDDHLCIYKTSPHSVDLIETVRWGAENFIVHVVDIIRQKCGERPILIINDMVEQHYRKERVIKTGVSVVDRKSIVKRKLNMAFPSYPVRAALLLKEKPGAEGNLSSDIYIFASVPETFQFTQTLGVLQSSLASVSAFCLLPVEASDMVQTLALKMGGKVKKSGKWTLFMGQHRSGSFRQIVTKDGELALTRMSPITEDDSDTALWLDDVYQEYRATMSYLTRFGYQPEDGLDIILIARPEAGHVFESRIEDDVNFYHMTVPEAAKHLGISIGQQESLVCADILHVSWIARKWRFVLPMQAKELEKVALPRRAAFLGGAALLVIAVFQLFQMVSGWSALSGVKQQFAALNAQKVQAESQYQQELQHKEEFGLDMELIRATLTTHQELEKEKIDLLGFFKKIGGALGEDMHLSAISLEKKAAEEPQRGFFREPQPRRLYTAQLKMTYPATVDVLEGNAEVEALRDRLAAILPDHEVNVSKLLRDYVYVEEITVQSGAAKSATQAQDYEAGILIRGPVVE